MSENAKTITFVAVGLCAIVLGLVTAPSSSDVDEVSLNGEVLTKAFNNPDAAKRLRIVRFDEDTATLREFEVAEQDGLWSIPSKDNYPADAAKQMGEAANSLMDRHIMDVASKNAGDHAQYGVIDPLSPKLEPGQSGVGTRVTMSDAQGKPLVDLIVGKAVKGAEGQRYVREAGRDVVYVIEIDPNKLSTSFEDWIEKDLLKLNAWDMQQVEIKDYSADMGIVAGPGGRPTIGVAWDPRSDLTLAYSDADAKWSPIKLRQYQPKQGKEGEYVDFTLADDEELNTEALNALKTALDDLKIVDVKRKPQGLSNDLKAGADFTNNPEAFRDLMSKGFAAMASPEGGDAKDIISSDGEIVATTKNGAEYVLRFGKMTDSGDQGKENTEEKSADASAAAPGKDKKADKGVHRYLFVMARLNKDAVKRPELVKLPDLPPAKTEAPATDAAANPPTKEGEAADGEAKDASTDSEKAAAEKADDAANAESAKKEESDATKSGEGAEKKDDAAAKKEAEPDKEMEKVIAERKRLEQENQRKLDEYEALIKKGEQSVKDLNLRFGDWYFVVGDDVFQKVRLSRDKVIKKKEKKAEGDAASKEGKDAAPPVGIPGLPQIPGATK
jgi:hypothetical protein